MNNNYVTHTAAWIAFNSISRRQVLLHASMSSSSSPSLTSSTPLSPSTSSPPPSSSTSTSSSSPLQSSSSSSSFQPFQPYEVDHADFAVPVYGYITPVFVITTMATNCLVCAVLLRKPMRSCTNTVLTSLAVSDAMTGLWPLPCFLYFYTLQNHRDYLHYDWCFVYVCLTDYLPTAFHTASIWLTVLLAAQRFIHVCHPVVAKRLCTIGRTVKAIAAIYIVAMTTQFCRLIDGKFVPVLVQSMVDSTKNITACSYLYHPLVETYINIYFGIFYWFRVLFVHIIPCLVLVLLNAALVQAITSAQRRRKLLLNKRPTVIHMQQMKSNKDLPSSDLKAEHKDEKQRFNLDNVRDPSDRKNKSPVDIRDPSHPEILTSEKVADCLINTNSPTTEKFVQHEDSSIPAPFAESKDKTLFSRCRRPSRLEIVSYREKENISELSTLMEKTGERKDMKTKLKTSSLGRHHDSNSTTMMLVVVVCLFLLVELPLAVLFILNFVENTWTLELLPKNATNTATLFINAITIVSYSCNFFVYCAMSNQFRRNFKALFVRQKDERQNGSTDASHLLSKINKREKSKFGLSKSALLRQVTTNDDSLYSPFDSRKGQRSSGRSLIGRRKEKFDAITTAGECQILENKFTVAGGVWPFENRSHNLT